MADLRLVDLTCVFDDGTVAVDGVDLDVADGETVALLGPSGCGKTTLLRLIAGLTRPSRGSVLVGGRSIDHLPSRERNLGMVAQTRTLPRRDTARRNIGFPTLVRGRRHRRETDARVVDEARSLDIGHLLDERTGRLSGGQQRMVQSARALVEEPDVLLLDEPFAMVERHDKLRMRRALRQRGRGVTMLIATADQEDALALADRVGVVFDGSIGQIGPPAELWSRPATAAVADFVGNPGMALLPSAVHHDGTGWVLDLGGTSLRSWSPVLARHQSTGVLVGFRPDAVSVPPTPGQLRLPATVDLVEPVGASTILHVRTGPRVTIVISVRGAARYRRGEAVEVGIDGRRIHIFDRVSGEALLHPI